MAEKQEETPELVQFEEVKPIPRAEKLRILEKAKQVQDPVEYNFDKYCDEEFEEPTDDGSPRTHFHLLEDTYDIALPKLKWLMKKFPKDAFITIGEASNPRILDSQYNNKKEYYRRDFFNPKLKLEEQILYRSNNKFNTLMVKYLLQFHTDVGLWKDQFIGRMNVHRRLFPKLREYKSEPHYVYAKFSRKMTNWQEKKKK